MGQYWELRPQLDSRHTQTFCAQDYFESRTACVWEDRKLPLQGDLIIPILSKYLALPVLVSGGSYGCHSRGNLAAGIFSE